jgi:hypothetical protein
MDWVEDKTLYLPFYGKRGFVFISTREAVHTLKHPIRGDQRDAISDGYILHQVGMMERWK